MVFLMKFLIRNNKKKVKKFISVALQELHIKLHTLAVTTCCLYIMARLLRGADNPVVAFNVAL